MHIFYNTNIKLQIKKYTKGDRIRPQVGPIYILVDIVFYACSNFGVNNFVVINLKHGIHLK